MQVSELLAKAQKLELKSRHLAQSHYAGLYRGAFKGLGMEFAEVREYCEGDDVRLIDWNVSARSQSLFVKKMVEERERNVLLLLDTSGSLRFGSVQRSKFDLLLELASIFVLSAFYAGDRVSLALVGARVDLFIRPAKGWNHCVRLIREMVSRRPAGRAADLGALWSFLNSPGVPRSLILFLTDFEAPLVSSGAFAVAARKHEIIALLVSDPREWSLPDVGRVWLQHPETGEKRLIDTGRESLRTAFEQSAQEKRESIFRTLGFNDVDWTEFSTATGYDASLRRFLEARTAKRGYRRR